jgi:hypothetical protein
LPSTAYTVRRSLPGRDRHSAVARRAVRQALAHPVSARSTATGSTAISTRRIVEVCGGCPHTPTAGLVIADQSPIAA